MSRPTTGLAITAAVLGAVVALAGFMVRSFESEYDATSYELVVRDDGTAAVFEPDRDGDWPMWQFEADPDGGDLATVVRYDSERAAPEVVFTGTAAEAEDWVTTRGRLPRFEGTVEAAEAWMAEQESGAEHGREALAMIVGGILVAVAALTVGWRSRAVA
jgi:hypothetical protein